MTDYVIRDHMHWNLFSPFLSHVHVQRHNNVYTCIIKVLSACMRASILSQSLHPLQYLPTIALILLL